MEALAKYTFDAYTELIKAGVPKEDARHALPSGIMTKIVATANIREWLHFVQIRECGVNCDEIQAVAVEIRRALVPLLPVLIPYLGPTCFTEGNCNEKKCCGRIAR